MSSAQLTPEKINEVELSCAQKIIEEFQKQTITYEQMREISQHILLNIPKSGTEDDLLNFLNSLATKWPVLQNVFSVEKLKTNEATENTEKIDQLRAQLLKLSQVN